MGLSLKGVYLSQVYIFYSCFLGDLIFNIGGFIFFILVF